MSEKFVIKLNDLNLKQIADSGQIFRMTEEAENCYRIWFKKYTTLVEENDGEFTFHCSEDEFKNVWFDCCFFYFKGNNPYSSASIWSVTF